MNLEQFRLEPLELQRFQVKSCLSSLLNTILFHRTMGSVKPRNVTSDVFDDLTYASCDNKSVQTSVKTAVNKFQKMLTTNQRGQLQISFFEKRIRRHWFTVKQEKIYWERWIIPIVVNDKKFKTNAERVRRHNQTQHSVRQRLLWIIQTINEKQDHLPPLRKNRVCYPYTFTAVVGNNNDSNNNWGGIVRNFLRKSPRIMKII